MNFFLKAFIWDLVITLLFVLLVPGVVLTLPTKGLTVGEADMTVLATHAAVFFVVYYVIKVIGWGIKKAMPKKKKAAPAAAAAVTTTPVSTPTATTTASSSAAKTQTRS
jgi:ABC-type long-subunit fatty acid transport system fused permease/ATPase subunit